MTVICNTSGKSGKCFLISYANIKSKSNVNPFTEFTFFYIVLLLMTPHLISLFAAA